MWSEPKRHFLSVQPFMAFFCPLVLSGRVFVHLFWTENCRKTGSFRFQKRRCREDQKNHRGEHQRSILAMILRGPTSSGIDVPMRATTSDSRASAATYDVECEKMRRGPQGFGYPKRLETEVKRLQSLEDGARKRAPPSLGLSSRRVAASWSFGCSGSR